MRASSILSWPLCLLAIACTNDIARTDTTGESTSTATEAARAAANVAQASAATNLADYVAGPGRRMFHKSCSHTVPDGARIDANMDVWLDGRFVKHIPSCDHPALTTPSLTGPSTWAEDVYTDASNWYDLVDGTVYVPNAPADSNGPPLLFFWNGVEGQHYLVQPVLSFGQGLDPYWQVANYFVVDNTVISTDFSTLRHSVSPGDKLRFRAYVDQANPGCDNSGINCNWDIIWENKSNRDFALIQVTVPEKLTRAEVAVFEWGGNIWSCANLPNNGVTTFSHIHIAEAGPSPTSYRNIAPPFTPGMRTLSPPPGAASCSTFQPSSVNWCNSVNCGWFASLPY